MSWHKQHIPTIVRRHCGILLLHILAWGANRTYAQTYPALVNYFIQPPYSPYLTDFLRTGQERMNLTINFLDLSEPSWDARLRITIEGNGLQLTTMPVFYEPVTLSPGPNTITGTTLANLFNFSRMNVSGMNKNDLVNAGRLPEGNYQFCVEVLDANRQVPLALPGCYSATLIQNNPPQLIGPECGATISAAGGQNIQFNWIPMHDPSIPAQYEIKLVQVPNGMNPNDAINATSTPILDWFPVMGTSFTYGPAQLPLEMNTTYAFQVRVVDLMGLTTFENQGKAPVCWFTYGFSTGGTIDLTAPANETRVDHPDHVDFAWNGPSNAVAGQQLKYHIKVVKLNEGEQLGNPTNAQTIIDRTTGVWYQDSTNIAPNIFGGSQTVQQELEAGERYAWQVYATTEGIKVATSPVWEFKAPPALYSFWCADGAYMVTVTDLTAFTKVNENKYTGVTGTGTVVMAQGEQPTEVAYQGLTIEMVANKWVLKVGEIVVPVNAISEAIDFGDFGDGTYDINAYVFTAMELLAQGKLTWRYPLSVNSPGNAVVTSSENVRLNYLNKVLTGAVALAPNQSYDLLIPMGFKIKYKAPSQFIIASGGQGSLNLAGEVYFPGNLKTVSGDPFYVPFEQATNPWYINVSRMTPRDNLALFDHTSMSLQPKTFVVDFSGNESPGIHSGTPDWVGVYITEYNIFLPTDFDESGQVGVRELQVITRVAGQPNYAPAWIGAGGLNLDLTETFESQDQAPYYATLNTFKGKFYNLRVKVEENSLSDSRITGFLKVPFLGNDKKLEWVVPIAANGFQKGYFNETQIAGFSKEFNKNDSLSNLTFSINQAVLGNGDYIVANVNLVWPYMGVNLQRVQDFRIWGNDEIGFTEPSGAKDLPNPVNIRVGDFTGRGTSVGAYYENTVYGFSILTELSLPGGLTTPGMPVKVGVAGPGGTAPPPIVYTRVDGTTASGNFRIGPFKVQMDNSLVKVDMYMEYIPVDSAFGSRFEARGDLLVKQPDRIVATSRLIAAKKDNTSFWYARVAAKGLNKRLESYPAFYLNAFDFKIYHHLGRVEGQAFTEPSEFKDFWDIKGPGDGSNSIDGHPINSSVALGLYGKVGLHDSYSGSRQKSGPINITETISIGDILPNIPGLCDLKYEGKSICSYLQWPWEGWDWCDIYVPVLNKSICEIDLPSYDWQGLQFCDLQTSNGKKLGDFTMGELGLANIDLCDVKLPGGMGLCEVFNLEGKQFCDIKDANGSVCNKKLCDLMPTLPPVCEWEIPGMKKICNFKIGDVLPDFDAICKVKFMNDAFICTWKFPDIFPDLPNPCDIELPNGAKLCSYNINWCDIEVPLKGRLCDIPVWNIDWNALNPCEWTYQGQSLCNLNLNACDLKNPLSGESICQWPSLCDLEEPITGQKFCELDLFNFDWPNFNLCDLEFPGTNLKLCEVDFRLCDLKNPINNKSVCDISFPDLLHSMPNLCAVEVLPNKELCDIFPDFNLPSICDLSLVGDLQLCDIKMPDFGDFPEINIPPLPGIPGMPENMRMFQIMAGLGIEVQPSGSIRTIAMDGAGWLCNDRFDPNSSYLARGYGGIELWPERNKLEFQFQGESGTVVTPLGRIKPICGQGTVRGKFTPNDWYVNIGTPQSPLTVKIGCVDELESSGYLTANSNGILAHGEIRKSARTEGGMDIGVADLDFYAEASLNVGVDIGVAFDDPAIMGGFQASASASAGVEVDPAVGDDFTLEFASLGLAGRLSFKVGNDFCMAGNLNGRVRVLGIGVDLTIGVEVKNGNISFPEDPDSCY